MPKFWPPRPSRFWATVLTRWRRYRARKHWLVSDVSVEGLEETFSRFASNDGIVIAPNHSHEADAHVLMEVTRRVRARLYFMAAWQAFQGHWGIDGWILQRIGAFSVDREGSDRRSLRQAVELLMTSHSVVIFPEGEIHHLNERLMPLLDGAAFIASRAQHKLEQAESDARVWILPVAIRYRFVEDISSQLDAAMKRLEARMFWWKPPQDASIQERIIRFGEVLLTIKEKEKLGRSGENDGDLPTRISLLIDSLLSRHEHELFEKSPSAPTIPLRVKALRRRLLAMGTDEQADEQTCRRALDGLDDVQLALQLFSYPGDYIAEGPTPERMAETIERYEEDVHGLARSIGRRRARVLFGEPIDMKQMCRSRGGRTDLAKVTEQLEESIGKLLVAADS